MESNTPEVSEPVVFHRHPRPYYPWIMWLLCIFLHFYNFMLRASTFAVRSSIIEESTFTIGSIAQFLDFYSYGLILLQIPVAILIDRFGPRRISSTGLLISAIGAILFGYAGSINLQRIFLFIMGSGSTISLLTALKIISNWFPNRYFAAMAGLTSCISVIGGGLGLYLTQYLTKTFVWRQTMIDYGIIGILYALLFFLIVRDSEPGRRFNINPTPSNINFKAALKKALSKKDSWFVALFSGCIIAPWTTFLAIWQIPFLQVTYKFSSDTAALINLTSILGFAIGAPVLGWASTQAKNRKIFMFICPLLNILFFCLTVYVPGIPAPLVGMLSFLGTFFLASSILSYTMTHEKNLPLITATVISLILIFNNLIRIFHDTFFDHIFGNKPAELSLLPIETIRLALMIVPISSLIGVIFILFVKDTKAEQLIEES
ncbi:MAG: MFS transporter [Simkania sp.]|nr:MFS transporter [Simkania sp.]MCP5490824.1 MFS transporter [Chlamydiales bacterium]